MKEIICQPLPEFNLKNPAEVCAAFSGAPALPMQQAWRETLEPEFQPGRVKLGWRADRLFVLAELTSKHPASRAVADNEFLWRLGDVFEMFLRDLESELYVEFHVAPNGKRLQLAFPSREAGSQVETNGTKLEDFMEPSPQFDFAQWQKNGVWFVCAAVPAAALRLTKHTLAGRTWLASFSRYDYAAAGGEPVLSSTSPHAVAAFHRQEEWARLKFNPAATLGGTAALERK